MHNSHALILFTDEAIERRSAARMNLAKQLAFRAAALNLIIFAVGFLAGVILALSK